MTSDLMPRLAGARTWKDDGKLAYLPVVPEGPARALDFAPMVARNDAPLGTACTVSLQRRSSRRGG